jgi:membrane fusion protein, heavy metal efflux system
MAQDAQPLTSMKSTRALRHVQLMTVVILVLVVGIGIAISRLVLGPLADQPENTRPAKLAAPPGTFKPTTTEWAGLKVKPVITVTFRPEQVTEGNIAIDDDLTTPVFSHIQEGSSN